MFSIMVSHYCYFSKERSVHPNGKMIEIHEMLLDPSTTYTAMVRTGILTKQPYSGTWSEWSSAVKWSTTYKGEYCGTDLHLHSHALDF